MKSSTFFAALASVLLTSCVKIQVAWTGDLSGEGSIRTITVNCASTRVSIGGSGNNALTWSPKDFIYVLEFDQNGSMLNDEGDWHKFVLSSVDATGKSGTFTLSGSNPLTPGHTYIAVFAANAGNNLDCMADQSGNNFLFYDVVSFASGAGQVGSGVNSDIEGNILFVAPPVTATSDAAPSFSLAHCMSVLEFEVTNTLSQTLYMTSMEIAASQPYFIKTFAVRGDGVPFNGAQLMGDDGLQALSCWFFDWPELSTKPYAARLMATWDPSMVIPQGDSFTITVNLADDMGGSYKTTFQKDVQAFAPGVIYTTPLAIASIE
ncbi:hypothetical protein FACS1894159_10160 [Bacteroidia bacterium]|nr:hypothetical protein FACS1894159_10160 [Bacteroidia bacterium]